MSRSTSFQQSEPHWPPVRSGSEPGPAGRYLDLPSTDRQTPRGKLSLPSQTVMSIRALFHKLYQYITADGTQPNPSKSTSLPRLRVLTEPQLLELVTDICDEIDRREPETHGEPCTEPFLQPHEDFLDSRNQSRQKLATLRTAWFKSLVVDVWTEIRRRHAEFTRDETQRPVTAPPEHHGYHDDDDDAEDYGSAITVSPAPAVAAQHQHHHVSGAHLHPAHALSSHHQHGRMPRPRSPLPVQEESDGYTEFDDGRTEVETVYTDARHSHHHPNRHSVSSSTGAVWLLDAEEKVRNHLGPGRTSHDYLHCDRVRRAAVAIAKALVKKSATLDIKVIELSALFTVAVNDPKHPVKEVKEFVHSFSKDHHGLLNNDQLDLIVRICRTVGVKKEERRRKEKRETDWHKSCRELHCVQDADKLDMLGCFGILRTAQVVFFKSKSISSYMHSYVYSATFGTTRKPLFDADHHNPASTGAHPHVRPGNAVAHFLEKERLIHLMRTAEGKALAQRRYERMGQFAADIMLEHDLGDL